MQKKQIRELADKALAEMLRRWSTGEVNRASNSEAAWRWALRCHSGEAITDFRLVQLLAEANGWPQDFRKWPERQPMDPSNVTDLATLKEQHT